MTRENCQNTLKKIISLSKQAHKLNKEGHYKAAEDIFKRALNLDDSNVYILVGLGDLNQKIKRFPEAVHFYKRSLDIEPANKFALAGLGDAYRGLQNIGTALKIW
jgi:tetratricopeptide (TPR) repeat protein